MSKGISNRLEWLASLSLQTYIPNETKNWTGVELTFNALELAKAFDQELRRLIPEKHHRKIDEEYGYCVTCNQIVDTPDADCFCSIHNLAIADMEKNIEGEKGTK